MYPEAGLERSGGPEEGLSEIFERAGGPEAAQMAFFIFFEQLLRELCGSTCREPSRSPVGVPEPRMGAQEGPKTALERGLRRKPFLDTFWGPFGPTDSKGECL